MFRINPQSLEDVPIDSIRPHPLNPRQSSPNDLDRSIKANGFYGCVLVQQSSRFILAGSGRWHVARSRGAETIPALMLDVDDATARKIMLADNRVRDLATVDDSLLAELLSGLYGSLDGTGYAEHVLEDILARVSGPGEKGDAEAADGLEARQKNTEVLYSVSVACANEREQDRLYARMMRECQHVTKRTVKGKS